jgi:hypothetical protein
VSSIVNTGVSHTNYKPPARVLITVCAGRLSCAQAHTVITAAAS